MDRLNQRERGKLPLSIGTSLAFETLIGINDNIRYKNPPLQDNDVIWINVKTLFRNIYQSIKADEAMLCSPVDYSNTLIEEIEFIKEFCRIEGNGIKYQFYCPNYRQLDKLTDEVLLRLDNSDKQKHQTKMMTESIRLILSHYNGSSANKEDLILIYDNVITDTVPAKALIFTSYALDLTAFRKFNRLLLMESHTGKIKSRDEWYTKYYNGSKLPPMPFRLDLLTILGDSSLFRNKTPALKREIIHLAETNNWTPITTASKIRDNAREIKNPLLKEKLLSTVKGI